MSNNIGNICYSEKDTEKVCFARIERFRNWWFTNSSLIGVIAMFSYVPLVLFFGALFATWWHDNYLDPYKTIVPDYVRHCIIGKSANLIREDLSNNKTDAVNLSIRKDLLDGVDSITITIDKNGRYTIE